LKRRAKPLWSGQPTARPRGGGSTSIDVTRKGIDKAYAVRKLMTQIHAAPEELLFVG